MGMSASGAATARTRILAAAVAALMLALGLAPVFAFADDAQADSVAASFASDSVAGPLAGPGYESDARSASADSSSEGLTLASTLAGTTASIVSADVALDAADPIVGSFTADGLTYAVNPDGVTLVAVGAPAVSDGTIAIPSSVTYNDATYDVVAVGPYAFYLSGATSVELPGTIASVDCRAFRSSDVERVEVDPGNPNMASYEGALYSADESRLLLIPEGRTGSVPIPSEAEVVEPSVFSHCSLVDAISVDGGGAAFLSWDGLLYSADGTTLLRVPAGATEITIRDGCTTIAAGAMEGCAKLERINAPASVASISPDLFTSVPTVSLPAQMAVQDGTNSGVASASADQVNNSADSFGAEGEAEVSPRRVVAESQGLSAPLALPDLGSTSASPSSEASGFAPQLTAMVALSTTDDDLPEVGPSSIEVALPKGASQSVWRSKGLDVVEVMSSEEIAPGVDTLSQAATSAVTYYKITVDPNGHTLEYMDWVADAVSSRGTINSPYTHNWGTRFHTGKGYFDILFVENGNYINFHDGTPGWSLDGFSRYPGGPRFAEDFVGYESLTAYANWIPNTYTIAFDLNGAPGTAPSSVTATYDQDATLPAPARTGYKFLGWNTAADGSGTTYQPGTVRNLTADDGATVTLYAQWRPYEIDFDVDSEPGDVDYPADEKPAVSGDAVGSDGTIAIEDPKRPGYVFEGWVIPSDDGTEAVDQDLVYQGDDGKWYVDASKLPDYAGDDGRVELTARWTSVISVDVPSSVTFYADLVTQGQESREGAAEGAFGQSKVANQSQVDLRVVGLESSAVKTEDSTLGADGILKKADAATPSTSAGKLLSLYPSTKQWTADELQNPDAVGGIKATTAVDFDLDDVLLEKSFKADDFTIAAGGTLNMGYRLNLSETGQQLDYDALSTLSEGQSASIANVSYCFAENRHICGTATGSKDDPLWIEYEGSVYGLRDIKASAECISEQGTASPCYPLYKKLLDAQVMDSGNPGPGPYFQLKVDGIYLPVQLIGICQDTKSDGTGKAGLTFQMRDIYAFDNARSTGIGGAFDCKMNPSDTSLGGWLSSAMRERMSGKKADGSASAMSPTFWGYLPAEVQDAIVGVDKYQQLYIGTTFNNSPSYLQKTTGETVWLPSMYEVFGMTFSSYNESEVLAANGNAPFQYMAYQGNAGAATNTKAVKAYNEFANYWWLRSANREYVTGFCGVSSDGLRDAYYATIGCGVAPAFCL